MLLDFNLRKWEMAIDLRIGHQFENLKKMTKNWIWKKDIDLRYRCLWRRNGTSIWGMDVDLSLTYVSGFKARQVIKDACKTILFMNKYVDNNAFTEKEDIIYK